MESLSSKKLSLPLACSRLLIGASFPEILQEILKEGECIVPTEQAPILGDVVVSRSPSYSPGDIRVLKVVSPPNDCVIKKLSNVILFATQGSRPDPDKISGGDLDGDLYLVIWDKRILEFSRTLQNVPANNYNFLETKHNLKSKRGDQTGWIRYVAQWESSMLAQVESTFFKLASFRGINSYDCKHLSAIFSRAVDQKPVDIDLLKQKIALASEIIEQGPIYQNFEHLPLWDRMLHKQLSLLEALKIQSRVTTDGWGKFFETIGDKTQAEIISILGEESITATASHDQIEKVKKSWMFINSNDFKPRTMAEPEGENRTPTCSYDCIKQNCEKDHAKSAVWYESWTAKMKFEVNEFIKPTEQTIEHWSKILVDQEGRLKTALSLYAEKNFMGKKVLWEKFLLLENHIEKIDNIIQKHKELEKLEDILRKTVKLNEPYFLTKFIRRFQNLLCNFFLHRNRALTFKETQTRVETEIKQTEIDTATVEIEQLKTSEKVLFQDIKLNVADAIEANSEVKFSLFREEGSLNDRRSLCMELKQNIRNNIKFGWAITDHTIRDLFMYASQT